MQSIELALMWSVIYRYMVVFQGKKTYLISASKSPLPLTHSPLSAEFDRKSRDSEDIPLPQVLE